MEWRDISTAPKDGTQFWGKDGDDAIAMLWHDEFGEFVSSWREMSFAPSWSGGTRLHSPVIHNPEYWLNIDSMECKS